MFDLVFILLKPKAQFILLMWTDGGKTTVLASRFLYESSYNTSIWNFRKTVGCSYLFMTIIGMHSVQIQYIY